MGAEPRWLILAPTTAHQSQSKRPCFLEHKRGADPRASMAHRRAKSIAVGAQTVLDDNPQAHGTLGEREATHSPMVLGPQSTFRTTV